MSSELLHRLFARHFANSDDAVLRLQTNLELLTLPFDPVGRLRELVFPPQQGLPNGMPSTIYYYVPASRQGSERELPKSVTSPEFLKHADGITLNLGCPVRLLRALEAFNLLSPEDQKQPLACLRDPTQHLATVEELLWLTGWKVERTGRGRQLPGMRGDVDWLLQTGALTIHLEAKYRRSDWARLVDYGTFLNAGEGFLSKATHKFPLTPAANSLHVVGITVFDELSEGIVNLVAGELHRAPQIQVVVIRTLLQMCHVLSLRADYAEAVLRHLLISNAQTLPSHYPVIFHIGQRDARRNKLPPVRVPEAASIFHAVIEPANVDTFSMSEQGMYRMDIPVRDPDGEPHFRMIPKYLSDSPAGWATPGPESKV